MEITFLAEILSKFEGLELLDTNSNPPWIRFKVNSTDSLNSITDQVTETRTHHTCSILVIGSENEPEYQLIIEGNNQETAIAVLSKKLNLALETQDSQKARLKELGLPDLSLVTIRQMATELKQRKNLTFAIVWIENRDRDYIAIEGSGNPTQLIGLLARGSHMAIEWADKNIKYYRPKDD